MYSTFLNIFEMFRPFVAIVLGSTMAGLGIRLVVRLIKA